MTGRLRLLNALLALGLVGYTLYIWPQLPERVPIHFNARFEPDRWSSRNSFLVLPLIGLATAAMLHGLARFSVRDPALVNMPGKDRLLALPRAEQHWVLQPVGTVLEAVATILLVMVIGITIVTRNAAHGHPVDVTFTIFIFGLIAAMTIAPLTLLVTLPRRLEEAHRRVQTGNT